MAGLNSKKSLGMCKGLHTKNVEAFPPLGAFDFFLQRNRCVDPKFRIAFYRWTVGDNKMGEKKLL
jgi:hypothetical protein